MAYHYRRKTPEERQAELKQLTDQLESGVKDYLESDKYKEILNNFSKFYDYSYRNTMLIMLQKPDASAVASYTRWRDDFNRQVNSGEKGIKIIQPIVRSERAESNVKQEKFNATHDNTMSDIGSSNVSQDKEEKIVGYKVGYTFDISQTSQIDGKEVIDLEMAHELTSKVKDFDDLKTAVIATASVPIRFEEIDGEARGFYSPVRKEIVIQEGMSESQTLKTMIHETAHSILHSKEALAVRQEDGKAKVSRSDMEVQAESVAYVVSEHYGLDTSDYSFPYVASWVEDPDRVQKNLEEIKSASSKIIDGMDQKLEQIQKEKMSVTVQDVQEDIKDSRSADFEARQLAKELDDYFKNFDSSEYYLSEYYTGAHFDRYFSELRNGGSETKEFLKQIAEGWDDQRANVTQLQDKIAEFNEKFSDEIREGMSEKRGMKL